MKAIFLILLLCSAAFAFTIESYENSVKVLPNGDLQVFENITFNLEKQYNEGFRSIRPADAPSTSYVQINSVRVNGKIANADTQVYDQQVEVFWTDTYAGQNIVELNYTLKDRVQLFNDYARVCYEHFGANWQASAKEFSSRMTMPDSSAGKDMHFEIYSAKKGTASLDGLSVVTSLEDVPPGNYVGGCYLFERNSVSTDNVVNGSAYEILTDERKSYGSEAVLEPDQGWQCLCFPAILVTLLGSAFLYTKGKRRKLPESILPPGDESPPLVAAIVLNSTPKKDLVAATMLDLINRGFMDIVELEKKGETASEAKRERTILIKKNKTGLLPHEKSIMDMIFFESEEVNLDEMAKKFKKVSGQENAKKHPIPVALEDFDTKVNELLKEKKCFDAVSSKENKYGLLMVGAFFAFFFVMCAGIDALGLLFYYFDLGNTGDAAIIIASMAALAVLSAYCAYKLLQPLAPNGYEKEFEQWDAFARGLKSSRIKEYPPSSVIIWGRILVYATALGLAGKVKKHLSELDALTAKRMEAMEEVRGSSYVFYASAIGLSNLSKYGNRQGFSNRSSGGWSSGGGGGFSGGGSSGGGGFR